MGDPERDRPDLAPVNVLILNDLVNLLTAALGLSTLLLKENAAGLPSPAEQSSIEDIRHACRRAIELVDTLKTRVPPKP